MNCIINCDAIRWATPIKCLDLDIDDTDGQLKPEDWLYIVLVFLHLFNGEAPFYWNERRGAIFLVILERSPHSMVYLRKFGRRLVEFFLFLSKTMQEVGWSVILWPKLYLEGWLSRSSYIIGVA